MMIQYKFVETIDGQVLQKVEPSGKFWTVPLDPANSDYAEYLRYTEWVEAGNDPDEFWSQSDDFLTLSESNETEAI